MASDGGPRARPPRRVQFLIWWQAFLAFAGYVTAAGVLSDLASPKIAAACLVIYGGLNQATGVYLSKVVSASSPGSPPGSL